MDLVNYSSSSDEELNESSDILKKDCDKRSSDPLMWLGISDDEDFKNFELQTQKELEYIKSNIKLEQQACELSSDTVGPLNRLSPMPILTSSIEASSSKNEPLATKRKYFVVKDKYEWCNFKNKKQRIHEIPSDRNSTFGTCIFEKQISKKCISSLEWYSGIPSIKKLILASSLDGSVTVLDSLLQNLVYSKIWHIGGCKRALWHNENIFSIGYDKCGKLWDFETDKQIYQCTSENFVTSCCKVDGDQNIFLTGSKDVINIWDIRMVNEKPSKALNIGCGQVLDFNFLPNQTEIVCCGDNVNRDSCDRNVSVWDFRTGAMLSNEIYHERYTCNKVKVDPLRNQFVTQTNGSYIAIFSAKYPYKMNKYKRFDAHKVVGYPIDITFDKNYKTLASGDSEGKVFFYNANTTNTSSVLKSGVNEPITSLAWSYNNKLVLGTWLGKIQLRSK